MTSTACVLALAGLAWGAAPQRAPARIEVASALVKLIEQVDVPACEAGILAAVEVREGQMVKPGDVLAQVMDTEARIAEDRARIELEIAKKNTDNDVKIRFARKSAEVAKAELRRSMLSVDKYKKSVSDSELDRLRLIVEKEDLEIEQADHEFQIAKLTRQIKENELRTAQETVQKHRIVAPLAGMVVQVVRHRGEWVKPGDMVLRILRLDRLRAEGFVKVQYLTRDIRDCPAKLTVSLPDAAESEFAGKIVFLNPEIDPVNAQVRVWAEIENKDLRLLPGMRARMTIELPTRP